MALAASRKSLPVVLALSLVVVLPTASWAALNTYLKLPDCDGPVAAGGLTGLIRLEGFTSKFANVIASSPGGGAGAGKAQAFFKITLTDVFITAIENTTVAKAGTEDLRNIQDWTAAELNTGTPTAVQEIVTLSFGKITLTDLVTNTTGTFDFFQ